MYITSIRVKYHVAVPPGKREAADRAVATHKIKCPAAMSVERGIKIDISADVTDAAQE